MTVIPLFGVLHLDASPLLEAWRLWLLWLLLLVTAWITNPNDASFKTFLTDLSFQQHLRRLRTSSSPDGSPARDSHVLTFTNRVAISFRTPQYKLSSFGLFSTVTMAASFGDSSSPTSPPTVHRSKSGRIIDCAKGQEEGNIIHKRREAPATAVFVGAFGRWWSWDEGEYTKLATKERLNGSIMAMESLDRLKGGSNADDVNDSEDSASLPGDLKPAPARKTHPVKATFRAGQRRASPTAKNFGGKAKLPTISGESTKLAHDKSSSVSSQVSIHPDGSTPPASASPAEVTPSDLLKEEEVLKENISGLRQQIALLETSSQDNQSQLQTELDDCKARKRDEEHHRTDLKAKARKLEESKRKAEVQYAEAERRHASAKSNKIKYTDKIERMKAELARLDRKEADFISKQTKSQAHREQRETELAPILESKKADMADRESAVAALVAKVETLEGEIEYHKTELSHRRERALRRSHSQRQFLPAHFVPVIANPEQMSPTSQQWASFPASTQPVTAPVNTTSPLAYNAVRGSPVSASETPSFFDHPRARQLDREEIPSKLPSRASSLRQPSEDAPGNALPTFAPFGPPVRTESDPTAGHRRAHSPTASSAAAAASAKNVSLPFFVGGGLTSLDGSDTPSGPATNESPRSPTTPHQNSLIPAHLFDMLDNDEDVVIPQTPMEVALPPRHNIWADDAVQDAFNRAGSPKGTSSAAAVADEDLSLDRIRSHDSSRASSLYSVPSAPLHKEPLGRHPLALNPGAKAFSPDAVSTNGNASVSDPSLHAQPVRRSLFGSTSLRDVWSRASNKTDHRSAAATAALFDADDIFSPVNHQTQQDGANHH